MSLPLFCTPNAELLHYRSACRMEPNSEEILLAVEFIRRVGQGGI